MLLLEMNFYDDCDSGRLSWSALSSTDRCCIAPGFERPAAFRMYSDGVLSTWTSAVELTATLVMVIFCRVLGCIEIYLIYTSMPRTRFLLSGAARMMSLTCCNSWYAEGGRVVRYWWTWQRRWVLFERLNRGRVLFTLSVCPGIPLMTWSPQTVAKNSFRALRAALSSGITLCSSPEEFLAFIVVGVEVKVHGRR